jgi:hypothetical protein
MKAFFKLPEKTLDSFFKATGKPAGRELLPLPE